MAKTQPDYAKIKAMAASILECIGDDNDTGEDPGTFPADRAPNDGGQESLDDLAPSATDGLGLKNDDTDGSEDGKRKKRKDDTMNLMASALSAKFRNTDEA